MDLYLHEGLEIIPDIDILDHSRMIWDILEWSGIFYNNLEIVE